ncbi:MAG TPA: LacI family DNA-binding transcriptional regulator [Thermoanaerobaculales bacterium]|nr:LacI family DNA-binding transcriptional regulator [Thermoanaerobaculales bacterium]HPA81936.1 LacI family DNA-binding transcriptional regulator [Thermoanaerobaculales bacterium]HQL29273.1 LacI family DNA-binding transcriptional regulator [Thermoanaerobaculales bacterium]HQN95900.1 LacI family DNA-binding transcriptional regulator [Thermoanaerobaculales bacterium]
MTLVEVARRAGVSPSTVSRVLNGTGRVSERTRARVLKIAEELKYRPDIHARALAGGNSRTLGIIVSNLQNPFFLDIFRVVEADALQAGYAVVVANTDYRPQQLAAAAQWMLGHRVAGLALVVSEREPAVIEDLAGEDFPVVFYDVGSPGPNVTNVKTDYYRGMQRAVEYLYALGHRRMAFVGHHADLQPLQDRKRSFHRAVARFSHGMESANAYGNDSPAGGFQAARDLLVSGFKPSAIICVNDFMALGVLRALREQGLAVPGDVSVVGYDNIGLSDYTMPALTTVNIPRDRIGHAISSALLPSRRASGEEARDIIIRPELIVRDSTGPAGSGRDGHAQAAGPTPAD